MSETTILSNSGTTGSYGVRYSRVASPLPAGSAHQQTSFPEVSVRGDQGYVKAYKTAAKSVVVTYNHAEARARALRKHLRSFLGE